MRCNNCGWDNPEGQEKCIKCNNLLAGTVAKDSPSRSDKPANNDLSGTVKGGQTDQSAWDKQNFAGTIKGGQSEQKPWDQQDEIRADAANEHPLINCTNCGYPVSNGADTCPKCGTKIVYEKESPQKTINPYSKAKSPIFRLTLLPRENESEQKSIELEGNMIELNRTNTEPENESISRTVHAVLEYSDGSWFISNPDDKATFIKVVKPVKIEPDHIILLGDRMFRIEK